RDSNLEVFSTRLQVLAAKPSPPASFRELDKVDRGHLYAIFRIAQKNHLLPLDHPEHVVLEDHHLDREPVLHAGRELSHEHFHATVAHKRDALPTRIGELGRDRVRKTARHRSEVAAQGEALAAPQTKLLAGPDGDRPGVAADDRIIS